PGQCRGLVAVHRRGLGSHVPVQAPAHRISKRGEAGHPNVEFVGPRCRPGGALSFHGEPFYETNWLTKYPLSSNVQTIVRYTRRQPWPAPSPASVRTLTPHPLPPASPTG